MQCEFAPLGAPAEFSPGAGFDFGAEEVFVTVPQRIAQAQPDEVGEFVDEDAGELGDCAIEGDAPFAEKGSRVNGAATIAQAAGMLDADGCALE